MNENEAKYLVWVFIVLAVIILCVVAKLNHSQMRPTPAQESQLIAAVHAAQEGK